MFIVLFSIIKYIIFIYRIDIDILKNFKIIVPMIKSNFDGQTIFLLTEEGWHKIKLKYTHGDG